MNMQIFSVNRRVWLFSGLAILATVLGLLLAQPAAAAISATITVDTTNDVFDIAGKSCGDAVIGDLPGTDGVTSLREAICTANNTTGQDLIEFDIPGAGPHTFSPTSSLPAITETAILDGTTEPDYAGTPVIVLDGSSAGSGVNGLELRGGDIVVKALNVRAFSHVGIYIESDGNTVQACYLGTNEIGNASAGNLTGLQIYESQNNIIGGATPGEGNLISGNTSRGIEIQGSNATNNQVLGNTVGANLNGDGSLANLDNGIIISGAPGNTVGGATPSAGNLISGNGMNGITIYDHDAAGNQILGNRIGTNQAGDSALPNGASGVEVNGAPDNIIGTGSGVRNVISGNSENGILITGSAATGTQVSGNFIGTNGSGDAAIPNSDYGIYIFGAPGNIIGGAVYGEGNLVSGNLQSGIYIDGVEAAGNQVLGNKIGTDQYGTTALPNLNDGLIIGDAPDNIVGGAASGEGNLISGNEFSGIYISGATASNNRVEGNTLGTTINGSQALPNNLAGVRISEAPGNFIGGVLDGQGNLISGNSDFGVLIYGNAASGNQVMANTIGLTSNGLQALPNGESGVYINQAPGNLIGGAAAGEGNVISGNGGHGVEIFGSEASGNQVQNNYIGTYPDGQFKQGNTGSGVYILGAPQNLLQGNIISANGEYGVRIYGDQASGNQLFGNTIGTGLNGLSDLGNKLDGVAIVYGAPNTIIGGILPGQGNQISANDRNGILVGDPSTSGTQIQGNWIGPQINGTVSAGNSEHGIYLSNSPGTLVGGDSPEAANLISGNAGNGVYISGDSASENHLQGNQIGTNASGTKSLVNWTHGVLIESPANTVDGNLISGNRQHGIVIAGNTANANEVIGNIIGLDYSGSQALPNGENGVRIFDAPGNLIGGPDGEGNWISGNGKYGVLIDGTEATGNKIQGNSIGESPTTNLPIPNGTAGVYILAAPGNLIGGPASVGAKPGNVISGNGEYGVVIDGEWASGNQLMGNHIGIADDGQTLMPNSSAGVLILNAPGNLVGGTDRGEGNWVSGNGEYGVQIEGSSASGNQLKQNAIGINIYQFPSPNGTAGVYILNAPGNLIGGPASGESNVISSNTLYGVRIEGAEASGNQLMGNRIGTDNAGEQSLPNGDAGVFIKDAPDNLIGGVEASQGNLISGNGGDGIYIAGETAHDNQVLGNQIGTVISGTAALPNGRYGIYVAAPENVIGSAEPDGGNLIAGNASNGIYLKTEAANGNQILGNHIGIDKDGITAIPNKFHGVLLIDAPDNIIGGDQAGAGNLISGNTQSGITIQGEAARGNQILGNILGASKDGKTAVPNGHDGVSISGAPGNTLGGVSPGAGNLISGNSTYGVHISGTGATNNQVLGNIIGPDIDGQFTLGEQQNGVVLFGSADNIIGLAAAGTGNLISGNIGGGILLIGEETQNNRIAGNTVGANLAGNGPLPNGIGVVLDDAPGNMIGGADPGTGNLISGNLAYGIYILREKAIGNRIVGNLVGTDKAGEAALPNIEAGIVILAGGKNLIGGTETGAGNLISGNGGGGIYFINATTDNRFYGNHVGTNLAGDAALPNDGGVILTGSSGNFIGGKESGNGNLISGNSMSGILLSGSMDNVIQGNKIGINLAGTAALPNGGAGVEIMGASNNEIGGYETGAGNLISGNVGSGIYIDTSAEGVQTLDPVRDLELMPGPDHVGNSSAAVGNSLLGNQIYGNGTLGIDLVPSGEISGTVTVNDPKDADSGPNDLQNYPVLHTVSNDGAQLFILGNLHSVPAQEFTVQFFASASCSDAGYGEGEQVLVTTYVNTDENGDAPLQVTLDMPGDLSGQYLTSTATNGAGSTSEFSKCILIPKAEADLRVSASTSDNPVVAGMVLTYAVTTTNLGPSIVSTIDLTGTIPAETTLVEVPTGCTENAGQLTCALGNLSPDQANLVEIAVLVKDGFSGTLDSQFEATSQLKDPAPGNNLVQISVEARQSVTVYEGDDQVDEHWEGAEETEAPCGPTFLGEFGNQVVTLNLERLPAHQYVNVTLDLFIIRSWDGSIVSSPQGTAWDPASANRIVGPDRWQIQADGTVLLHTTFSNWDNGLVLQAYPGKYPQNAHPAQSGASEVNSLCYQHETQNMDATYQLEFTFEHSSETLQLDFEGLGLQGLEDESWGLANVAVQVASDHKVFSRKIHFPLILVR